MLLNYANRHLNGLSWVRFGLALYLIFFHTLHAYKGLPDWLVMGASAGFISTSMFFILSGYVLTHVYYDQSGVLRIPRAQFLSARFFTLYPLHIIGFFLAAIILLGQYLATNHIVAIADVPPALIDVSQESIFVFLQAPELAFNAFLHLLVLHAWNPLYLTFNIPSWSISALMFFYIIFVFLGGFIKRIKHPILTLILLNCIYLLPPLYFIFTTNYSSLATGLLHTNPLLRLPEFLSGVVLCFWLRQIGQIDINKITFLIITAFVLLALISTALIFMEIQPSGYYLAHNGILMPFQLILIALFAGVRGVKNQNLNNLINRLGNATLSIFVLHLPLFYLLTRIEKLVAFIFDDDVTSDVWQYMKQTDVSIELYLLNVIIIIAISVAVQERFVLRVRKSLKEYSTKYF